MTHSISHESRTWLGWPSIQKASLMLKQRIEDAEVEALRARLKVTRQKLWTWAA